MQSGPAEALDVMQNGETFRRHESERTITLAKGHTVLVLSQHRTGRPLITDYENATDSQIDDTRRAANTT